MVIGKTVGVVLAAMIFMSFSIPAWSDTGWAQSAQKEAPRVSQDFGSAAQMYAEKYNVSKELLLAIILTESVGKPDVKGGLTQVTHIARRAVLDANLVKEPCPIEESWCSIRYAAAYLALLKMRFGLQGWQRLALAYNAGPSTAKRAIDPGVYRYVRRIGFARQLITAEL